MLEKGDLVFDSWFISAVAPHAILNREINKQQNVTNVDEARQVLTQ